MRFPLNLVIELDDGQLELWADVTSVPRTGGQVRAKDAVEAMREQVPAAVLAYLDGLGVKADVSVKR